MLPSSPRVYILDGVEIDTSRVVVRRAGEECRLRPKTFSLLIYLLENRNRLVPKQELIEQLWPDTAVSDGALARCVNEIRTVLGEDSRNPRFVRTAARIGYQFIGSVQDRACEITIVEQTTQPQVPDIEHVPLQTPPVPFASAPRSRGGQRILLFLTFAVLSVMAGIPAWNKWGHDPATPREPEWWEVAWWKLNEGSGATVTDSIHGLRGKLPAGASWTQGILGSGLLFTGREPVRGEDPSWVLPSGARTLTAWVKTNPTQGDLAPIFGAGEFRADDPPGAAFGLALHVSGAGAFMTDHFPLAGKTRVDDNSWHQVTGVFDGKESRRMHLFIDGVEEGAKQLAFPLPVNNLSQWFIGTAFYGSTIVGSVDDARIYERALRADEIRALYSCVKGEDDIAIGQGGSYYFSPIFGNAVEILPRRPGEESAGVRNTGRDFAGVTFVRREADCPLRSIHGADLGQDLTIAVDLRVPAGPHGAVSEAGPYFRSRRANPGDGIMGGTSAGFWVRLDSTGHVRVQRLYPGVILGLSAAPPSFDARVFHNLRAVVRAGTLEVALDGRPLAFDVRGVARSLLQIPPAWETVSPKGNNGGSAGIAFGCMRNRGEAGGQEARNIRIAQL